MPYRRKGKRVQVKRNGKWVTLKTHVSVEKAKRHERALRANVKH